MSSLHETHVVTDWDPWFFIDPKTRMIVNKRGEPKTLIQYDHNSERMTFEMPRYIEGHDMSKCNLVEIHYTNVASRGGRTSTGVYEVEDMKYHEYVNDILCWTWLVDGNALLNAGNLEFMIRFACTTDEVADYVWNTADNTEDVIVAKSLAPSYLAETIE